MVKLRLHEQPAGGLSGGTGKPLTHNAGARGPTAAQATARILLILCGRHAGRRS